jgi:hypothetical protein
MGASCPWGRVVHGAELSMGASCPWERVVHGASHHGVNFHRVNCGGVMIRPEDISSLSIAPGIIHLRSHYIPVSLCPIVLGPPIIRPYFMVSASQ